MKDSKHLKAKSNALLLLAAIIWGFAFVAQKQGGHIGTFTYNAIRMFIGAAALTPVILWSEKKNPAPARTPEAAQSYKKNTLVGGALCGVFLFFGTAFQQAGLAYIPAGKSGFITAIYTLLVLFFSILIGKKVRKIVYFCAFLCVGGLYFLCMAGQSAGGFGKGEILTLCCAVAFAGQVMAVDHYLPIADGMRIARLQLFTAGVLSFVGMLFTESPDLHEILQAWLPILYVGIFSSAGGYTLQIVGQKHTSPTEATIILSLESVFSVLGGMLIMHDKMVALQYMGCVMIFVATLLPNLPTKAERAAAGVPKKTD